MSFTVPFFSGSRVFSLCSLTLCLPLFLVLDMDILLRNVPACSHSCHSQFLEPSYMSTIIYSNCSLELSSSPPSLRIAMGPSVHILLVSMGNTEFSPTPLLPHGVLEPLGHTSSLGFLSRGPTSGFLAWKAVCRLPCFLTISLIRSRAACQIRKAHVWACL